MNKKAAVFILLGQSNAVGHAVPMEDKDIIREPLRHVFGLNRDPNQSFTSKELIWSGYTSAGTNLAETQDNTYSIANCLAGQWENAISAGTDLPNLYIIQIAIGAQGVCAPFMWYPDRPEKLVPGSLGTVDISLYPFTRHILSMVDESIRRRGETADYIGIHWRGGSEDTTLPVDELKRDLPGIYNTLFKGFLEALGKEVPIVVYHLPYTERELETDPSGESLKSMHFINGFFAGLSAMSDRISVFDITDAPHYIPDTRTHGIFIEDAVHCNPKTNQWIAECILNSYVEKGKIQQ